MSPRPSTELEILRQIVASSDEDLLHLLERRLDLVAAIARVKATEGLPGHDPVREEELVSRAPEGPVRDVYRAIVASCREAILSGAFDDRDPEPPTERPDRR